MPLSYTLIPSVDNIQEFYKIHIDNDITNDSDCCWDYNLWISWDYTDETIDNIMDNEIYTDPSIKANWLWLEEIKKLCDYKLGDEIWIVTKQNSDGYFNCWFNKKNTKTEIDDYFKLHIDKEGYCSYRKLGKIGSNEEYWVRCNSIYNDNIQKIN